jgi:hypothetical protein
MVQDALVQVIDPGPDQGLGDIAPDLFLFSSGRIGRRRP